MENRGTEAISMINPDSRVQAILKPEL